MTLLLILLLLLAFIWPVNGGGKTDLSNQQTPPKNYYRPGDYLIAAVVPLRTAMYPMHTFKSDPIRDLIM